MVIGEQINEPIAMSRSSKADLLRETRLKEEDFEGTLVLEKIAEIARIDERTVSTKKCPCGLAS